MDFWTEIPAALSSSTDVYSYDQATGVSVPAPQYQRFLQSQPRPIRLEGGLELQYRLPGPGQDGRQASSPGAAIPAAIAKQSNVYGYDQSFQPSEQPPPYEERSSSSPLPQPSSESQARQHPDGDLIRSWSEVVVEPRRARLDSEEEPNTYLCLSAVVTFFFCWPLGLLALSFSRQAKKAKEKFEYNEARMLGKQSLWTSIIGIAAGLCIAAIIVIVNVNLFQQQSAITYLTTRSPKFHFYG